MSDERPLALNGISVLRRGFQLGVAGVTLATLASAVDDLVLYYSCEREAMAVVEKHPRLLEELGDHLTPRTWWNASVSTSNGGNTVNAYFVVDGSKASSDIYVKAVRFSGSEMLPNLVYNIFGEGRWQVLYLDAMLPDKISGSRLPIRVDLLAKNTAEETRQLGTEEAKHR
ncbi:hypothetical protein CYMTET_16815 [Cymbomonas tetramitiformis]|uniref:Uncharacterized protein n=1 Tax=Cymbomonas tetramitiformis TaxID=36881 RepID=A0AAE0GBG8_9CHLO|nr:hypothetical protein CYMTET_16815 [Cymbomonas tetramitiformis]